MQEMMQNMHAMVDEDGNLIYGEEVMESEGDIEGHEMMHEGDSYGHEGSPYEGGEEGSPD